MATVTTIATGVAAAIGGRYDPTNNRLIFAAFHGFVSTIDLATLQHQQGGTGYNNPEDVAIVTPPSGAPVFYVTDRIGTFLRLNSPTNLHRGAATVLVANLIAPQQIAITDSGAHAYVIEYRPPGAGPARLLRIDLASAATTTILSDVAEGVGVVVGPAGQVYITEQSGGGRLSEIDAAANRRVRVVASNLPAPFFLAWQDAARTQLLVPLRDPTNRIMQVDFAQVDAGGNPRVVRLIEGVPWRPSCVASLPGGRLAVFADREVIEYDMAGGPQAAVVRGMGGGASSSIRSSRPSRPPAASRRRS